MSETIKIEVFIRTDKISSECTDEIEFDREEWESMTDAEKTEVCRDVAFNMGEWGWREQE